MLLSLILKRKRDTSLDTYIHGLIYSCKPRKLVPQRKSYSTDPGHIYHVDTVGEKSNNIRYFSTGIYLFLQKMTIASLTFVGLFSETFAGSYRHVVFSPEI